MATIKIEVISGERVVYADDVDIVVAPGVEGQLGILPQHAPLLTTLQPGELVVRKGTDEVSIVVSGGFLEVQPEKVIVLADTAERAEEIDVARAEAARQRAAERLQEQRDRVDLVRAEASLRRSLARLKVAEKRRKRQR
ncbi:MAG: F0F1 ATP synthase subunit epsilon [Dehalococcoidales bacterium]|nr:F0F1 ATP synthase subunit epsilon [Dehalococcoidales bacterium]